MVRGGSSADLGAESAAEGSVGSVAEGRAAGRAASRPPGRPIAPPSADPDVNARRARERVRYRRRKELEALEDEFAAELEVRPVDEVRHSEERQAAALAELIGRLEEGEEGELYAWLAPIPRDRPW